MIKQILGTTAAVAAAWGVAAPLTYFAGELPDHRAGNLVACSLAALLCLVPTLAAIAVRAWLADGEPIERVLAVFLGMGLRLGVALLGGLALYTRLLPTLASYGYPWIAPRLLPFWGWLLAFYLFTLAVETILARRAAAAESTGPLAMEGRTVSP